MARNYTLAEAVEIINAGKDLATIADIGKRFPLLAVKVAKITAQAGDDFVDLMRYMPEKMTANKINSAIKSTISVDDEDEEQEEEVKLKKERKAKKSKKSKKEEPVDEDDDEEEATDDYDDMDAADLFKECKKRGIKAKAKRSAKFYANLLREDDAKSTDDADSDDDWEEEEEPKKEKKAKKSKKAKKEPPMPNPVNEDDDEDEDDDWDI